MLSFMLFIIKILFFGGIIGFLVLTYTQKNKKFVFGSIISLILFVGAFCIDFVPANNVGVKWSMFGGTSNQTLSEGIVIKAPFDKVYIIPTTVQERTMKDISVQTNDSQFLKVEINVKFSVNKENAYNVYKRHETIDNLKKNIISNYSQKALSLVCTDYNIVDILGEKQNEVYQKSSDQLEKMLKSEGVNLVQLTFKDLDAGKEIEKAIRDEAVAKKNLDTAIQNKEKAKTEAETKLIQAEGEAKANKVKTKALTSEVLLEKWIETWDGKVPYVSGSDGNMIDISELFKLVEKGNKKK